MPEIDKLAAQNAPMPEGLNSAQQMYYQGLCLLYARHREGGIDTDAARREKAELTKAYEKAAFELSLWEAQAKRWADLAGPAAEFRKHPNLESAWKMHEILYGFR